MAVLTMPACKRDSASQWLRQRGCISAALAANPLGAMAEVKLRITITRDKQMRRRLDVPQPRPSVPDLLIWFLPAPRAVE